MVLVALFVQQQRHHITGVFSLNVLLLSLIDDICEESAQSITVCEVAGINGENLLGREVRAHCTERI